MIGSFSNGGLGFGVAFQLQDEFSKPAGDIERAMGGLEGATDSMTQKVQASLNQMASGAKLLATGGALVAPFLSNLDKASDLQESATKATQIFGESVSTVNDFVQTQSVLFGQSKQQAQEAIATYGNLFTALGMGEGQAANLSISLNKLASDLASFNNTEVDVAIQALRGVMTGEFEMAKRFGIAINADLLKQKALQIGVIDSVKAKLDPLAKMQAAYALVMEQTANAQGDFVRTSEGYANSLRITEALWTNFTTILGQIALPLAEKVIRVFNRLLSAVTAFAQTGIGKAILKVTFALGGLLVVIGSTKIAIGAISLAFLKLSIVAKSLWASLVPLLPYLAIAAAVAAPFVLIYLAARKATKAFQDMEQPASGVLGFFQRMGGYLTVIREVWKTWDSLSQTFTLTDQLKDKLDKLGILESAVALGTWVVRVKEFLSGMWDGIQIVFSGLTKLFSWLRKALSVSTSFLDKLGIRFGKNVSEIESWAFAGKVAGAILMGVLTALTLAFASMAVSTIAATWPLIAVIGGIGLAIWGVMKIAEKWNDWWNSLKDWGSRMWIAGKNMISNLWEGMKSVMSELLTWIDESLSSIPILGHLYDAGKFVANTGAFLGGEVYSAVTGEDNPVGVPELPKLAQEAASFAGRVASSAASVSVTNTPQPVSVTSNTFLDGDLIQQRIEERQELNAARQ